MTPSGDLGFGGQAELHGQRRARQAAETVCAAAPLESEHDAEMVEHFDEAGDIDAHLPSRCAASIAYRC